MANLNKGKKHFFYKTELNIDKNVFRPRFETEQLVDNCQEIIKTFWKDQQFSLLEIGVGSGAIIINLAKIFSNAKMTGVDISLSAIDCAQKNAFNLGVKITWKKSNLFEKIQQKFNVIIANLPYIANDFPLSKNVEDFDPKLALFGGKDGLDVIKKFLNQAKNFLEHRFLVALEYGWDQKEQLEKLVKVYFPKTKYNFLKDYQGKNRFLFLHNLN